MTRTPSFVRPEPPHDDSRLRKLEMIAVMPITAMWAWGALVLIEHGSEGWMAWLMPLIVLGGVGILCGWIALLTRDPLALPRALRFAVAAGLAIGVGLTLTWVVPSLLTDPSPAHAIYGCALVPGIRHFFRFIRARPQAMKAG